MGKFDGVLLAADFDNTLRPENMARVPERNLLALEYFMKNGGRFTLATGRDLRSFRSIRHLLTVNAPVVLSNGAALFDPRTDTVVYEAGLPRNFQTDVAELMARFPGIGVEVHRGFDIFVPRCNRGVEEHLARMEEKPRTAALEQIDQATKFALFTDTIRTEDAAVHEILKYLESRWRGKYEAYISGGIVDVAAAGVSKASGVQRLLSILGLKAEHLYCAGDGRNDLPMMVTARESFAPADANPAVLCAGPTVVCSAADGALGEIVGILDKRYGQA